MPERAPGSASAFDFDLHIEADIAVAKTLPASFYSDPAVFAASRARLFARTWQLAADSDAVRVPQQLYQRGRYSLTREQGVHHFHRLLAEFLSEDRR